MLVTALNPRIGYDKAVRIGKMALAENMTLKRGGGSSSASSGPRISIAGSAGGHGGARRLARRLRWRRPVHLRKRSFPLAGHRTCVALEQEFWAVLEPRRSAAG